MRGGMGMERQVHMLTASEGRVTEGRVSVMRQHYKQTILYSTTILLGRKTESVQDLMMGQEGGRGGLAAGHGVQLVREGSTTTTPLQIRRLLRLLRLLLPLMLLLLRPLLLLLLLLLRQRRRR